MTLNISGITSQISDNYQFLNDPIMSTNATLINISMSIKYKLNYQLLTHSVWCDCGEIKVHFE